MSLGDGEAAQEIGTVPREQRRTQSDADSLISHCIY